jgi:hypothetical protein
VTVSLPHHPHRSPSCHVAKWSLCIFPYWMPQGEQIQDGYLPFEGVRIRAVLCASKLGLRRLR